MVSPHLARSIAKIESLPTDDGSVLDTIAGAILRIFVRINQIEADNGRLGRRLAALEQSAKDRSNGVGNGAAAAGEDHQRHRGPTLSRAHPSSQSSHAAKPAK
jgi:hypothetical protein